MKLGNGTILDVTGDTPAPDGAPAKGAEPGAEVKWPAKLTGMVAQHLRRWREELGLSAQQLADRTRVLGFHVPRSVIANLENGRRETLSIAEFLVLAAALDVPPVLLIADLGRENVVEILPDVSVSTWLARGWILGAADPVGYETLNTSRWLEARRSIVLYDIHKLLVREHQQTRLRIKRVAEQMGSRVDRGDLVLAADEDSLLSTALSELAYSLDRIRSHRELIQKEGFLLPALPSDIAAELLDASPTGRHHTEQSGIKDAAKILGRKADLERPIFFDRLTAENHKRADEDADG